MIYNRVGVTYVHDKHCFTIGGTVRTTAKSDYPNLVGILNEICDGKDLETENDGPDFYCVFDVPWAPKMVKEIEDAAMVLYRMPKKIEELGLDYMIMSSDEIVPIARNS